LGRKRRRWREERGSGWRSLVATPSGEAGEKDGLEGGEGRWSAVREETPNGAAVGAGAGAGAEREERRRRRRSLKRRLWSWTVTGGMAVGGSPRKEGRVVVVVGQISDECQGEAMLPWMAGRRGGEVAFALEGGLPFFFTFFLLFLSVPFWDLVCA
jgi:hypothetical protein